MMPWSAPAENKPSVSPGAALLCAECDSAQVYLSAWYVLIVAGQCVTLLGLLRMNEPDVSDSPPVSARLYLCIGMAAKDRRQTHPKWTQPVGLSLGEHTMTKKGPAVIASPCLMWFDDGSSLAPRWETDELSGLKQRREIDTSGLHIGNIRDTSVCLATAAQVVTWWLLCFSFEHTQRSITRVKQSRKVSAPPRATTSPISIPAPC